MITILGIIFPQLNQANEDCRNMKWSKSSSINKRIGIYYTPTTTTNVPHKNDGNDPPPPSVISKSTMLVSEGENIVDKDNNKDGEAGSSVTKICDYSVVDNEKETVNDTTTKDEQQENEGDKKKGDGDEDKKKSEGGMNTTTKAEGGKRTRKVAGDDTDTANKGGGGDKTKTKKERTYSYIYLVWSDFMDFVKCGSSHASASRFRGRFKTVSILHIKY